MFRNHVTNSAGNYNTMVGAYRCQVVHRQVNKTRTIWWMRTGDKQEIAPPWLDRVRQHPMKMGTHPTFSSIRSDNDWTRRPFPINCCVDICGCADSHRSGNELSLEAFYLKRDDICVVDACLLQNTALKISFA